MNHFRTGRFPKNRLEAFSDGVLAIIVTLLVLEIKVPGHGAVEEGLGAALAGLAPKFFSWVVSFMIVAVFWVNHHRFLESVKEVDNGLLWLNCLLLLWLSFIPFPTALMGEFPHEGIAVTIFGIVLFLASLTFSVMRWYAGAPGVGRSLFFGPGLYAAAVALSALDPVIPMVLYALIPAYFILPRAAS
jgi:uncharacterized membrane protein